MKFIYKFDDTGKYIDQYLVEDNYEASKFETEVQPSAGLLMPYHWQDNQWVSATSDEANEYMNKYVNQNVNTPDANQLMLNQVISMLSAQQVTINTIQAQLETEK